MSNCCESFAPSRGSDIEESVASTNNLLNATSLFYAIKFPFSDNGIENIVNSEWIHNIKCVICVRIMTCDALSHSHVTINQVHILRNYHA